MRTPFGTAWLAAALTAALWAGPSADAALGQSAATKTTAKAMLAKLTVAVERDSFTGFPGGMDGWARSTRSKCKYVYDEVISREALEAPKTCVKSGTWKDPWLGNRTGSYAAMTTVRLVDVGEAWQSGAFAWDARTGAAFANDLNYYGTLVAVTEKAENARQDREPGKWLPSKKGLRCAYVTEWIGVKYRWRLSVDQAEHHALSAALALCPATKIKVIKRAKVTMMPAA